MEYLKIVFFCAAVVRTKSMSLQNGTFGENKFVTTEMFDSLRDNMTYMITDISNKCKLKFSKPDKMLILKR